MSKALSQLAMGSFIQDVCKIFQKINIPKNYLEVYYAKSK